MRRCSCGGGFLAEDFGVGAADVVRIQSQRIELKWLGLGDNVEGDGSGKWRLDDRQLRVRRRMQPRKSAGFKDVRIESDPRDFALRHLCCPGEEIGGRDHAFLNKSI